MTDKRIIIDGVPVQDCCYFDYENDGYKDSCYIHQNECSAQNCYYKQLKRKEQECKNLEEELRGCRIGIKDISIESTEICKISEKYKQALDNIEARIQLENADDCLLDVMEIIESVKEKNIMI